MNQRFPYIIRISERAKGGAAEGPNRVPSRLKPVMIGVMAAGVIGCGIYYWGLAIPAEKQKALEAERQASEEKQKELATQAREKEQKRQQATGPQTRVVPDQYATIQAAIDAAKAGDTVLVKVGVYNEALKFKEGIELRGENRDTTIVRFSSPPTGVVGQDHYDIPLEIRGCATGTVLNIGFEQERSDDRTDENIWMADAIELFDSSIAIENCRAQSDAGAGILVFGTKSAPTLLRNQFRQNKQGGISFEHGARGKAENNVCEENQYAGIMARGTGTSPELVNNQCRGNEGTGILFKQEAQGKAESNVCEQNKEDGILVNDSGTSPELVNNLCRGNEHFGIEFYDAQGGAERNACEQNHWSGIAVSGSGAAPELANNQCRSNELDGIVFQNQAHSKAQSNVCERNKDSGISVIGSGTSPQLENNQCRNNANAGIYFDSGSNGRAESNICEGNASSGILINAS
ncbi:MAG TPA: right-handed parallel beta-helix repeat-containing protein, partial [Chthoniobacterales bacterium]|nr:right-handed parallel beta-helix repeat-containing protein [Chthoniobacterales bacterium]